MQDSIWNEWSLHSHTLFGRTAMGSAFKTVRYHQWDEKRPLLQKKYNWFCLRLILSTFPEDRQFFFTVRTPTLIAYVSEGVNGEENTLKTRFEKQLNLKITVYYLTCDRWTDSLINHRHRVTYRMWMASWMMNTDVIRFRTSIVWRLTWNKSRTGHPERATNASVTSTWRMKTATRTICRASIILRGLIAYLRFHLNY
jgi:hypothetical protein